MATNRNNEDPDRQPTEFEIRRAELVGQIGDVSGSRINDGFELLMLILAVTGTGLDTN